QDRSEDKLVVLDVLAADLDGRRFNIEMQTTLPTDLAKRLTYYNCMNYVRQLSPADPYFKLRPAISICVLNRVLFPSAAEFHLSFRLRCDQQDLIFSEDLVFHVLELPKFESEVDNVILSDPLEKWLYFLKHAEHLEADELAEQLIDSEYREAAGVLEMISKSPEEQQFYEARMKFLHDNEGRLIAAREEGREEGLEQGREQGLEQGREQGLEKGSIVGRIQALQELLGDEASSLAELSAREQAELASVLSDLQSRLRSRGA
ncbi:MAG: Rpn family recombination-promoting nuclease/putative transposase, partial [Planctomycetota bacterium]|nr:Rpn family recombination-promoting nuclease/putative transposase [Planctomycetota bacterium]